MGGDDDVAAADDADEDHENDEAVGGTKWCVNSGCRPLLACR
jgi:hypothetical protein